MNQRQYEREANNLARTYAPDIYPCKKCGHPVVSGYCCTFCNDENPSASPEPAKPVMYRCRLWDHCPYPEEPCGRRVGHQFTKNCLSKCLYGDSCEPVEEQ